MSASVKVNRFQPRACSLGSPANDSHACFAVPDRPALVSCASMDGLNFPVLIQRTSKPSLIPTFAAACERLNKALILKEQNPQAPQNQYRANTSDKESHATLHILRFDVGRWTSTTVACVTSVILMTAPYRWRMTASTVGQPS